jgi:hypothetical protein
LLEIALFHFRDTHKISVDASELKLILEVNETLI